MSGQQDLHPALVARVLSGDPRAIQTLHDELRPVIRACILKTFFRPFAPPAPTWDPAEEAEDLTQEVFAELFDPASTPLRSWSPEGGRSLPNYVRCLAERRTLDYLRVRKNRRPKALDDLDLDEGAAGAESSPERAAISKETARRAAALLHDRLSPLWLQMFYLIFVDGRDTADLCVILDATPEAVQKRRSRLREKVQALIEEIASEDDAGKRRRTS